MVIVSTIWMLFIDPPLGMVAVIVFPLLVTTNVVYERLVSGHFARAQHHLGEFSAGVHESFEGVQLVKSYGAEERETDRLSGLADQVRSSRVHALRLRSWFEAFLDVIPSLTNILLVVIGSVRVRSGDLSIGELSGVIFLFTLLVFPLRLIGFTLSELPRSIAAWNRIQTVLHEPIEDDPVDRIIEPPDSVGISFDHVSFAHEGDGPPTIIDVTLALPQGNVTALVGSHGSGKSTIAQLAIGLIAPIVGRGRPPSRRALHRVPGGLPHGWHRARQRRTRRAVLRRRDLACPRSRGRETVRRAIAAPPRHRRRRAWGEPEWRPAPTTRTCPCARPQAVAAGSRRHDLGARSGDRGRRVGQPATRARRLVGADGGVATVDDRPRRRRRVRRRRTGGCARDARRTDGVDSRDTANSSKRSRPTVQQAESTLQTLQCRVAKAP